ncbi:Mu transposase C-terminal domain-containing protein, partial [Acinetobacter sp. 163]|nr:Mu transposase C-terminal domain-containing protein [Acinetobacter sp. 163]
GKFTRQGLKVNGIRYKHENYTEKYLSGGSVTIAYNPEDVSFVWMIENGSYVQFELIEGRYRGKGLSEVENLKESQRRIVK